MILSKALFPALIGLGVLACQPIPAATALLPTPTVSRSPVSTSAPSLTPPAYWVEPSPTLPAYFVDLTLNPRTPVPTPTRPTPSPSPTFQVELVPFNPPTALPAGLSVTIYQINRRFGYGQIHEILRERSRWVAQNLNIVQDSISARLDANNAALKPFGYRLEKTRSPSAPDSRYDLYQGNRAVVEQISITSPVSVNRSKDDFVMEVLTNKGHAYTVRSRSLVSLLEHEFYCFIACPQFLGDDLLRVQQEQEAGRSILRVYRNNLPIYKIPGDMGMIYGLWTYGDHWAFEVRDNLSIDGQDVNQQYNYQKSYIFSRPGGRTLYLFEKNGKVGLNFNGQEVLLDGQSVPHYYCCESALENPYRRDNMMIFFMQNGEQWYYVEVEVS